MTPIRWSDVAAERGHTINEHTKFADFTPHVIDARTANPGDILGPLEETPTGAMIDAVGDALLAHSGEDQECIVAVWYGFGSPEVDSLFEAGAARIPGMGQQTHFVLSAPLGVALEKWRSLLPDEPVSASSVASRSPQAIWPRTMAWFYAVPFDCNTSFFAGTTDLVGTLLDDERIESYKVSSRADYRHKSSR